MLKNRKHIFGVDISKTSVRHAKKFLSDVKYYDGRKIPFANDYFDLVLSFNVIEHVDKVEYFLNESLRILKHSGILIIVCPNFLSITNSYHWHTAGFIQKMKNFLSIIRKILSPRYTFDKMKTIINENFKPDDDACNVMNPIDIYKWSKKNKLKILYYSSQQNYSKSNFVNTLDFSILKIFFGSVFFIFKKER